MVWVDEEVVPPRWVLLSQSQLNHRRRVRMLFNLPLGLVDLDRFGQLALETIKEQNMMCSGSWTSFDQF
jgi:hypothetical protein